MAYTVNLRHIILRPYEYLRRRRRDTISAAGNNSHINNDSNINNTNDTNHTGNSIDAMGSVGETRPSIAILGAGIGGLALAIGLLKRGVPVTIYEAAAEFSAVGAGIGFGPNSLHALDLIDPKLRLGYDAAKTANQRPEFEHSVFDALYAEPGLGEDRGWTRGIVGAPYFTRSSAHRKDLLEILKSFIPDGTVQFDKRARSIEQNEQDKKVTVYFEDGKSITVDALIGCDGVKGITREAVLGETHPEEVAPRFGGMHIYRGILPMEAARDILGEHAGDAKFFMADRRAMAIYPISKGSEENFVFFVSTADKGWPHGDAAVPCDKETMLSDLNGDKDGKAFDPRLLRLLDHASPLRWPMWHHPKTTTYHHGRVCLLGDVAHASTPHQAAGAGQGLEDAVVLSNLLALVRRRRGAVAGGGDELSAAFQAYDAVRRPRASRVVETSFEAGQLYTWQHPEIGDDMEKIVANGNQRLHWIWQHDIEGDIKAAEDEFKRLLKEGGGCVA